MSSIKSGKKITALQGIADASVAYTNDVVSAMKELRAATETIKVPKIDALYNGIAGAFNSYNEYSESLQTTLANIAITYSERDMGAVAREAFNDCATYVGKITGALETFAEVEPSTGLDEEITDETVASFVKALTNVVGAKDPFLNKIVAIVQEDGEADTTEILNSIGGGIETLSNRLVDIFDAHSASVKEFGISLDEATASVKSKAANLRDESSNAANKMALGSGLM